MPVQLRDLRPGPVPDRVLGEVLEPPAGDVPARVARERVRPDRHHVDQHDDRAEPDAEVAVRPAERLRDVVGEQDRDRDRQVKEVAVQVLHDQREPGLASVGRVRLAHRARGRRPPERPVIGAPVVVAGQPEAEHEHQRHERVRDDRRHRGNPLPQGGRARDALAADARGVERCQVVVLGHPVPVPHEHADRRVENPDGQQRGDHAPPVPPRILAERPLADLRPRSSRRFRKLCHQRPRCLGT